MFVWKSLIVTTSLDAIKTERGLSILAQLVLGNKLSSVQCDRLVFKGVQVNELQFFDE